MITQPPCALLMTLALSTVLAAPLAAQQKPAAAAPAATAPAPAQTDPLQLVVAGRKLAVANQLDEAIAKYEQALKVDPQLYEAHLALGNVLDLKARYADARKHFEQALSLAEEGDKDTVLSQLAVSYVFAGDITSASRTYQQQFDRRVAANRLDGAAETANALGRVYLETGDVKNARRWYETAHTTIQKVSGLPSDQLDLFEMRWHHALSRIAARSHDKSGAAREAAAVKALIDKGGANASQQGIYDYLIGYNAFHAGDNDAAIAALQKASQDDPFIVGLIAQSYAKKKDAAAAKAAWTKVLAMTGHSLQNALTRPLATKALAK